jgi:hypothetical protein
MHGGFQNIEYYIELAWHKNRKENYHIALSYCSPNDFTKAKTD